jgi:hypothetical protein
MDIAANTTIVKPDSNFGVLASTVEQKITAVQVKEGCPKQLLDLGEQAAAHLTKAYAHREEYEQHLAKAKEIIGQVRQLCDDDGFTAFYEIFHETFCPNVGRSRTYELLALATGKTSIKDARAKTRERVARHRAKRAESVTVTDSNGPTDTCGNNNDVSSVASAEERKAQNARLFPESESATNVSEPPALDPVAIAVKTINALGGPELKACLEGISAERQNAFKQHFTGGRSDTAVMVEIADIADMITGLLKHPDEKHPDQHRTKIYKNLERIKQLTGHGTSPKATNAKLNTGAFAHAMGWAGQPGKTFPTMNMTPVGVDPSGQAIYALPRADHSNAH